MLNLDPLLSLALDLTAALSTEDRNDRLLALAARVIPCDAAVLFRWDDGDLIPMAAKGLLPEAKGRRYAVAAHPRLSVICNSEGPVRFPANSKLPDPFDGLVAGESSSPGDVHACLGCPLRVEGELVGVLTADALAPGAFDHLDESVLQLLSALAGAALRTGGLIEALQDRAEKMDLVAVDLMQDALARGGGDLIGTSPSMTQLRQEIGLVAPSNLSVLISGETGVGKELVARAVQRESSRSQKPLIYVNCAALPESVAESELFGHLRGAFTGADRDRAGKFEIADGGTLFLDEIGELPLSLQPKLLRALQEGEVQRVGSDQAHFVDVRILSATNRDLEKEVAAGRFRADLYHRLRVYELVIPPLRDRVADIAVLAGHFCDLARRKLGLGPLRFSAAAIEVLEAYAWPGNVRELKNLTTRVILRAAAGQPQGDTVIIDESHLRADLSHSVSPLALPDSAPNPAEQGSNLPAAVEELQIEMIRQAVADQDGNWSAAARQLGLDRSNLHRLAKRLNLLP